MIQETGEAVGNTIGKIVQVADPKDDGQRCEFLQICVSLDITKPLPRCCKLWSEGEHIGWALLKFERLPNFAIGVVKLIIAKGIVIFSFKEREN